MSNDPKTKDSPGIFDGLVNLPGEVIDTVDKTVTAVGDIVEGIGNTAEELPMIARAIRHLIQYAPIYLILSITWTGVGLKLLLKR